MTIPTATSVRESAVISASVGDLWNAIQLDNVHSFWTNISDVQSSANVTKWTFHDGTVLDVKQEEHSVRPSSPTPTRQSDRSISDQSLNSRVFFSFLADRQIAATIANMVMPTEHRPLYHLLGHQRPASAELLLGRLHDPAVPSHVWRPRREHLRGLVGQLF
jgi:hypothetical protein